MKRPRLPQLTEPQARSLIAGIAVITCTLVAALVWGLVAVVTVQTIAMIWVLHAAALALDRADQALEVADQALGPLAPNTDKPVNWQQEHDTRDVPQTTELEQPNHVVEPTTEPIPAQPATVPTAAVIADEWQKRQDQLYREAMAAIHGKDQT